MEVNGFREMLEVTTPGRWLDPEDFATVIMCSLSKHFDVDWLRGIKGAIVMSELISIGFIEMSRDLTQARIKPIWYDSI